MECYGEVHVAGEAIERGYRDGIAAAPGALNAVNAARCGEAEIGGGVSAQESWYSGNETEG